MSRFQIADEAIPALWDSFARKLDRLIAPYTLSDDVLEATRDHFFVVLNHFSHHVLNGVVDPTDGAPESLRIAISDSFERHLVDTAKSICRSLGH